MAYLPERRAKVKQLLKLDQTELWCICQSSDISRFMIGCDNCDEWYHGDCINVTEKQSKKFMRWYCHKCKRRDSTLTDVLKAKYAEDRSPMAKKEKKSHQEKRRRESPHGSPVAQRRRVRTASEAESERAAKVAKREKEETSVQPPASLPRQTSLSRTPSVSDARNARSESAVISSESRPPTRSSSTANYYGSEPRQCLGPGCRDEARSHSKYCSDDCGLALAKKRILTYLPERLQAWKDLPPRVDAQNRVQLIVVREKYAALKRRLLELDEDIDQLNMQIEATKRLTVIEEDDEEHEEEESTYIYCWTCGHHISPKGALRHFERCFVKQESQMTCWGPLQTRTEGEPLLCDFYSSQLNMYCKRLRVVCPEHYKEKNVLNDSQACGCPAVNESLTPNGEFCRVLKKKCNKHPNWDRLRRAQIDLERFRLWFELEELLESEGSLHSQLARRGCVLGLLLHKTVDENSALTLTKV